jgi:hypothetical protein
MIHCCIVLSRSDSGSQPLATVADRHAAEHHDERRDRQHPSLSVRMRNARNAAEAMKNASNENIVATIVA